MTKPDFFNINPDIEPEENLTERFKRERAEWATIIKELSASLKNVLDIPALMVDLYSERQRAAEYHHYIMSILSGVNKTYRARWNERYEFYTLKSQIRYPNETTKATRIQHELADIVEQREQLDNQQKYMMQTISSLDAIIYGINNRVKIEEIIRGSK
ncbi:MAG: hypothetical protein WC554_19610 [Clostridia bacterium]|jgi:hypothetical protein